MLSGKQLIWEDTTDVGEEQAEPCWTAPKQPMKYHKLQLSQRCCEFHVHEVGVNCAKP